jgi:hypothetical protein
MPAICLLRHASSCLGGGGVVAVAIDDQAHACLLGLPWAGSGRVHAVAALGRRRARPSRPAAAHGLRLRRAAQMAPEKVVVIWTAGGIGPTTSMPSRWISSLSCWKPSATSPRRPCEPTGTPGWACTRRPCSSCGDAPALEQLQQRDAARAGGIADAGRGEHGRFSASRWRRPGAARRPHGDGDAGAHQVDALPATTRRRPPACRWRRRPGTRRRRLRPPATRLAASTPPTDSIATGRRRAAPRPGQVGQHLARGHGRDSAQRKSWRALWAPAARPQPRHTR